jgi:hypothetical protein
MEGEGDGDGVARMRPKRDDPARASVFAADAIAEHLKP